MRIDLHLHSAVSDGSLRPERLVRAARAGGLDVIALADHDTVAGVRRAEEEGRGSVHVIPAMEISSTYEGRDLHFLGYFIDPEAPAITRYTDWAGKQRARRIRGMIELLEGLGVHVEFDDVVREAGAQASGLARPHLARVLVDHGAVDSFAQAFDRFIGDEGPAFLPTNLPGPRDAFALIHEAGGVAAWAHPPLSTLDSLLPRFVDWGMDGLECYRPRLNDAQTRAALESARAHGLFPTGGSDWHGDWHGRLGDFAIGPADVRELLDAGGL